MIEKYILLIEAVELGSITKAAERMGYTQSSVSQSIHSLERDWGFPLLVRKKTGVELTEQGERVYPVLQEIVSQERRLRETVAAISGLQSGVVRIGSFPSIAMNWLPEVVHAFQQEYPRIDIQLFNGDYLELEDWLNMGKIDCGFNSVPARSKLESMSVLRDDLLAVVPADHPLAERETVSGEDFIGENFIVPCEEICHYIQDILSSLYGENYGKLIVKDANVVMAMVEGGLGVSILPELCLWRGTPENRSPRLVSRPLKSPLKREVTFLIKSYKRLSQPTKSFVHFLRDWLQVHGEVVSL